MENNQIKSMTWWEHIRFRPGMYIGKTGDGLSAEDGIYILLKEIINNSIDEFLMGAGKKIEVKITDNKVEVRDYGRGIPFEKVVEVVSSMITNKKKDTRDFKKSVGLYTIGTKVVNALSAYFKVESVCDGQSKFAVFEKGILIEESPIEESNKEQGTIVTFVLDESIFKNYKFRNEHITNILKNYVYLNPGLTIFFNGEKFYSENGLKYLLNDNNNEEDFLYPIIHFKGEDIEIAITHSRTQNNEEYYSFVNGHYTSEGGKHLKAFRKAFVKTIRKFYNKSYKSSKIRKSIIVGISIKVIDPIFYSSLKKKLVSTEMGEGMPLIRYYIEDFIGQHLFDFLEKNTNIAEELKKEN